MSALLWALSVVPSACPPCWRAPPQEVASLVARMAPPPSAERMLRAVLRYVADAVMLQLMSGELRAQRTALAPGSPCVRSRGATALSKRLSVRCTLTWFASPRCLPGFPSRLWQAPRPGGPPPLLPGLGSERRCPESPARSACCAQHTPIRPRPTPAPPRRTPPCAADAIPEYNIFGLQRLYSDLGGIRWGSLPAAYGCHCSCLPAHGLAAPLPRAQPAGPPQQRRLAAGSLDAASAAPPGPAYSRAAGSMGVPGLADELAEPMLFCEMMVFGRWAGCVIDCSISMRRPAAPRGGWQSWVPAAMQRARCCAARHAVGRHKHG